MNSVRDGRLGTTDHPVWRSGGPAPDPATVHGTTILIERAVVLLLLGGLLLGVLLVLRPFATAILFALVLVVATWPLRLALVRGGLAPGLAGAVMALGGLALVGLPVLAVAPRLASSVAQIGQRIEAVLGSLSETPPDWLAGAPVVGDRASGLWRNVTDAKGDLGTLLVPYADWLRQSAVSAASALADSALQFLLALVIAGMLWAKGEVVAEALRDIVRRLGGETATQALAAAGGALRGVAYGVVGTAFIQAVLMGLGAGIAGVPAPVALGFIALLLAISQIGAVLLPAVWGGAAWWLFRQDAQAWGVFMLVWGLVLVSMSDNVIRPWLISRGMSLPLTLVILGVFGGFVSLGFLGLFIGPALLAVAYTLLQAWRTTATPEDR